MSKNATTWKPGMGKVPGSGRQKGSVSKKTGVLNEALGKYMCPGEFLAAIMSSDQQPIDLRVDCAKAMMPYKCGFRGM